MRLFIVGSGQSNALGGNGGEGGDQTPNPRVKVWNGTQWTVATLGVAPFAVTSPPRNNPIWHFCKKLQERWDADVYFVLSATAGRPISDWAAPNGPEWIKLDTAVKAAMGTVELVGKPIDYFVWFQGEADTANTHYREDFVALREAGMNEGWWKKDTPVLAGELIDKTGLAYAAIAQMSEDFPWFRMVPNRNAQRVGGGSALFTGDGYTSYGRSLFFPASLVTPKVPG